MGLLRVASVILNMAWPLLFCLLQACIHIFEHFTYLHKTQSQYIQIREGTKQDWWHICHHFYKPWQKWWRICHYYIAKSTRPSQVFLCGFKNMGRPGHEAGYVCQPQPHMYCILYWSLYACSHWLISRVASAWCTKEYSCLYQLRTYSITLYTARFLCCVFQSCATSRMKVQWY